MILGCDMSHWQGSPDFTAVRASGRDFVVLKATEGHDVADAWFAAHRPRAHDAGLVVGMYHYARAGDPLAEARWFAETAGRLTVGEFVCLDWEVAGEPVDWCAAWLAAVEAECAVKPLVYLNQSLLDGHDWSPVIAGDHGLWLARYDGRTDPVSPGRWPVLAMKQYDDAGTVPGITGDVDLDVFYGDADQLRAYGYRG